MEPIRCMIIDDDALDRLALEAAVDRIPFLTRVGSYAHPLEALEMLRHGFRPGYVQVLLLDIDMPWMNGLDFYQSLPEPPLGIFITAHPEYALESYEVHAFDFLTKPLKAERFAQTAGRVREWLDIREKAQLYEVQIATANHSLVIKEGTHVVQIPFGEVLYLEALKDYTKIVTAGRYYLTLANLKTFAERLPPDQFLRIHRSYAVAVRHIRKWDHHELLLEPPPMRLPVGKTFRREISEYLLKFRS